MGYPDRPATAEITLEVMKQTRLRVLYAPPSIIENLVQMPGAMDLVKRIEHVIYAGGPLGKSCGDTLSEYTKLSSIYGSTETATVACVVPRREDWQYLEFHPIWKPDMEAIGDGTFEMVVKKDDEADKFRGIGGTILISEPEYRSRDLFIAHPTKKGLWRFLEDGRKDDILVLSNGEKWNPVPSEGVILEHPGVSAVLAVGNGMFQPGAIIEAAGTVTQEKEFIDSVWPFVERANRVAQRHGRIVRSRIAVVDPGAFLRSPKGTVVRRTTEKKLQSIIDGWLETSLDSDSAFERDKLSDADCSPAGTLQVIRDCCQSIEVLEDIQDHEDIFTKGLDSLEVIELAKNIKNRFAAMSGNRHTTFVNQQLIFRYPTLEKLAYKLYQEFLSHQTDGYEDSCDDLKIPDLIEKYSTQLGQARPESPQMHLVLTGSTGSLGQEILRTFLKSPEVSLVTCLDRDAKARSKAESKFGSQYRHAWNKVNFMTVDFQKPYLGLTEQELGFFETVHAIIHCAWRVNFNQTLASFELHIRALCELRSIVSRSYWKPRLCFVSSMSAVANYSCTGSEGTVIPEEIVYDDAAALPMGYGQSKYVAERILANAANDLEIPITILRLGQVAGTVQDATKECQASSETTRPWNPAEWVPSLIATSGALGQLPSDLPPVDWIPANRTAKIILELVLHDVSSDETLSVYNLVNPRSSSWSSLIPAIQEGLKGQCKLLHYSAWLQKLRELDVESKGNVARYPALRIMTYLEQKEARGRSILYTTTRATARSSTMANLEPVSAEWMGQWMEQWHFV
ncbi:MAG: putative secondary metabolism biosynthetic enzyme [Bogoriella megaspora]|nr:MAG: putative secondary metabolism biosynthetic enzyme [Bogoriella megaspora]